MLIKHIFGGMRLAHVSLAFAGLMCVLPFLSNHHDFPLLMFYQEWGAALLGLCAMPLLVTQRYWQQPEMPRIILLPIGLSLLVMVQFAVGKVVYLDQALLFALYMLWAALLAMLGHRLREELGLPVLCTALAACLLLGAESNALVGVLQLYVQCAHPDYIFLDYLGLTHFSGSLAGNLAQTNHFANYTALGLVSLGLLYLRWRLRGWQVVLLAAPLLFALALSGSRSPWLYLTCMAGMAFMWQRRERKGGCLRQDRPQGECLVASPLRGDAAGNPPAYPLRVDKSCLPLLYYSLALLLGFGLMHFVAQAHWLAGCSGGLTSGERLITEGMGITKEWGGSTRFYSGRPHLWHAAWLIFTQFPLLGAGFGQFGWQNFQLGPVLRDTNNIELPTHAHNLVLQIAAEMGLAGLLVLLGTLALWFWQADDSIRASARSGLRNFASKGFSHADGVAHSAQRTIYHWWGYGLLAVLAIHSLLEFPLWYAYFLGVAALTLGIFDTTTYRLKLCVAGRLSVAAMLLLGLLSLSQLLYLYKYSNPNFEVLAKVLYAPATDNSYTQRIRIQFIHDHLVALQGHALLLRPYVEIFLAEAEWDHINVQDALNERVMRYLPISSVVYRQGWLLARAGRQAEACAQMERAIWSDPSSFPETFGVLRELVGTDTDPARFSAFLECVLKKYGNWQREAHAKF